MNGEIIEKFAGLRANRYSLKTKKEEMKMEQRDEEERSQKGH